MQRNNVHFVREKNLPFACAIPFVAKGNTGISLPAAPFLQKGTLVLFACGTRYYRKRILVPFGVKIQSSHRYRRFAIAGHNSAYQL